jgi:integrase
MVHLFLDKRPRRPGYDASRPVSVRLSIRRHRGHRLTVSLPLKVEPRRWSDAHERLKPSAPGATQINAALVQWKAEATALLAGGETDEAIRAALVERTGRAASDADEAPLTMLGAYDLFSESKAARVRPETLRTYATLRAHVAAFLESSGLASARPAEAVTSSLLADFLEHLTAEGMANSTANKLRTRLRGFLSWLHERGEIESVPKARPLPESASDVLFLRPDELARLAALDFDEDEANLRGARDLLLFCCSTGQRFGDVKAMRWEHVSLSPAGVPDVWELHVSKTSDVRRVPLVGPAGRIVRERRAAGLSRPVPTLAAQTTNRHVKTVAERAGLDRPVTRVRTSGGKRVKETKPLHACVSTHIGRKTFVTLAMQSGMGAADLLGFTHDDLRTLRRYVGQDEARRAEQMQRAVGDL